MYNQVDQLGVNTLRTLSIDAIQRANSGHPGLPMGAAPMAYVLWTRHLKINPKTHMNWVNRDRFVLSAGHGSALLYSLAHLAGYDVSMDDLKNFREWKSNTPGHPEYGCTDGVEATTGPLGQGISMAVGMAMAEAHLGKKFNREGYPVMDHYTYALIGDGDLMEGVASEAASLAGHLKLGKLIALYDSNGISLDGKTSASFTENVGARFEAYGWQYILVEDGFNLEEIDKAIVQAKAESDKPTIIEIKTTIGYGSENQGTHKVHGSPLGEEGVAHAKKVYNWNYPPFTVPEEVSQRFKECLQDKGVEAENKWNEMFEAYKKEYSDPAQKFSDGFSNKVPNTLGDILPQYGEDDSIATRAASQKAINALAKEVSSLWGGAADLASSNKTVIAGEGDFQPESYEGRNIWFGVREFGMACAMNGIMLHGGTRVFGSTFFVFSDYLKAAIRLSAIQKLPVIYVLTHDSVAVGKDGPTHEPIEQLASLRTIPNVQVLRPADGNETSAAWKVALETLDKPTILVLSRQNLDTLPISKEKVFDGVEKGGYVVQRAENEADGILIATGSEVGLALKAKEELQKKGKDVSVVSLPSWERFEAQSEEYKNTVIPPELKKRMTIEAGTTYGWAKYAGDHGVMIGIDEFGMSAPSDIVLRELGMSVENIVSRYLEI
ncbi:transketolase (plasmid) [Ligilactobacillus salivarius]|uniref:Transketolase n=1 Tax=Ligilactobacillus salivarius TaxID=1624 RepID=A0ABD7YWY7_9LACO|nr:transketolase [Ligilactobacillus salivarius]WHS05066.1 transketolase [Ligilactobacillus salivarius]WHS09153.1 transketolase [Ligilactobacillus salivarius]WHS11176.1 transketolase [Ligilactobacillus salivarius]WHS15208.1 transketolase [Ligilactobacillus salivarius]WHS18632.1 transketolase [Ligilactobacillus salivarius]